MFTKLASEAGKKLATASAKKASTTVEVTETLASSMKGITSGIKESAGTRIKSITDSLGLDSTQLENIGKKVKDLGHEHIIKTTKGNIKGPKVQLAAVVAAVGAAYTASKKSTTHYEIAQGRTERFAQNASRGGLKPKIDIDKIIRESVPDGLDPAQDTVETSRALSKISKLTSTSIPEEQEGIEAKLAKIQEQDPELASKIVLSAMTVVREEQGLQYNSSFSNAFRKATEHVEQEIDTIITKNTPDPKKSEASNNFSMFQASTLKFIPPLIMTGILEYGGRIAETSLDNIGSNMFHHHNEEILSLAREIAQQKRFLTPEHRMIIDSEKEKEKQLLAEAQAKIEEDKEKRKARNSPKPPATKETIDEDLANYTGVATHQSRQAAKDLVSSGITKNIEDEALRLRVRHNNCVS